MDLIKKYIPVLYALLLAANGVTIYYGDESLRVLSKVLLVPLLLAWLGLNRNKGGEQPGVLVYLALVFAFLGDVLLTRSGDLFFLSGMLAFMGTHVCNGLFFYRMHTSRRTGAGVWIAAVVLLVLSAMVYIGTSARLGKFTGPVLFYMGVISLMAIAATGTADVVALRKVARRFFMPGAFLFVLSDALLAMNKFRWKQPMADIAVMITYGCAQYLLVSGFIGQPTEKRQGSSR